MFRSRVRGLQTVEASGRPKGSRTDYVSSSAEAVVAWVSDSRTAAGLQREQPHLEVRKSRSLDPCRKGSAILKAQDTTHTCSDTYIGRAGLPMSLVTSSLGQAIRMFFARSMKQ